VIRAGGHTTPVPFASPCKPPVARWWPANSGSFPFGELRVKMKIRPSAAWLDPSMRSFVVAPCRKAREGAHPQRQWLRLIRSAGPPKRSVRGTLRYLEGNSDSEL
jgi:hypothetical protein